MIPQRDQDIIIGACCFADDHGAGREAYARKAVEAAGLEWGGGHTLFLEEWDSETEGCEMGDKGFGGIPRMPLPDDDMIDAGVLAVLAEASMDAPLETAVAMAGLAPVAVDEDEVDAGACAGVDEQEGPHA